MSEDRLFREALRSLLLPIDPGLENEGKLGASDVLASEGVAPEDRAAVLRYELQCWREEGSPTDLLDHVVQAVLCKGDPESGAAVASRYFDLHATLCEDYLLTFEEARGLLSHLRLALYLIREERMSCAQVARVIQARRRGAEHTWQQVHHMCRHFAPMPALDLDRVKTLTQLDETDEEERFADATTEDEIALIAFAGSDLGFPGDLQSVLRAFTAPETLGSLLIILHFAVTVAEFYDHPPSATYELRPRGRVVAFLKDKHPSYEAAENPFLNLAKGASAFDLAWVWGRDPAIRSRAGALVQLLVGLEGMGYSARREIASLLRQWLIRLEKQLVGTYVPLSGITSVAQIEALMAAVAEGNTQTHGIVEQRVVDAFAEVIHPRAEGWYPRGLGDSVNASNLSCRKTGDCEFEHSARRIICAYEAHGGKLAKVYVDGHLKSMESVLEIRRDDLASITSPDEWDVNVTYVAHDLGDMTFRIEEIGEFTVAIEFIDYASLFLGALECLSDRGLSSEALIGQFNARLIGPSNEKWTPQQVRDRIASMF